MVGRKSKIPYDKLVPLLRLRKNEFLDADGVPHVPSHPCWSRIANEFVEVKITPKHIWTLVKCNRIDLDIPGSSAAADNVDVNSDVQLDETDSSKVSDDSSEPSDSCTTFNITLSADEWRNIKGGVVQYCGSDRTYMVKNYDVLAAGWTSVIARHIYSDNPKLQCCLTFKRAKVHPYGGVFLNIRGHCKICNSSIKGTIEREPSTGPVTINFLYSGHSERCVGKTKRRLHPQERMKYAKKLIDEKLSAVRVQSQEAARFDSDSCPMPLIPSLNTLRLIKSRGKRYTDSDPILSVIKMKGNIPFDVMFRDIGYDPFFLHYWSAAQVNAYRVYTRQTSVTRVSIDATGSIVRPIHLLSGRKTRAIYFYEIAVRDSKKQLQFPIAHMLSERHNNVAIAFFLFQWMREDIKTPNIVVTDQSRALMMACARAFTQYGTIDKYMLVCSSLVREEEKYEIPTCMIRNDFAHVMHDISTWPGIKDAVRRSKDFYLRTMALIVSSTCFTDMKVLLQHFFTVLLHEEEGFERDGSPCKCEIAKKYLKNLIKSPISDRVELLLESLSAEHDGVPEADDLCDDDDGCVEETNIFKDIEHLYKQCQALENNGDRDNLQYSPDVAKKLLKFCKSIVLWSAITVPIFGYGHPTESSSASESSFKKLKIDVLKSETLPMRLDEFIPIHVEYIMGSTNIIRAEQRRGACDEGGSMAETLPEPSDVTEPEPEENWRGQNEMKVAKVVKKLNYLQPNPNIESCNIGSKAKASIIGLLRNGCLSDLKSIPIDGQHYTVNYTCAFDSICQIIFTAYAEGNQYCNFINTVAQRHNATLDSTPDSDNNSNSIFFVLIHNAMRDGITVQTYRKRAQLLTAIDTLKRTQIGETIVIDASCNVTFLCQYLFKGHFSFRETKKCEICTYHFSRDNLTVLVNLSSPTVSSLEESINISLTDFLHCPKCVKNQLQVHVSRTIEMGHHLLIEVVPPRSTTESHSRDMSVSLTAIPQTLNVMDKHYTLRGVVSFRPPTTKSGMGHYVAYCWRPSIGQWQLFDDLQNSPKFVRASTVVKTQFLIYSL